MEVGVLFIIQRKHTFYISMCVCVQNKRSTLQEQLLSSGLNWKKIVKFIDENSTKENQNTLHADLRTILQAAKQIGKWLFYN